MPAEKTQSFCPCSRVLNRSGKGLNSTVAKKRNSQQTDKGGKSCKIGEIESKSTFCKPEGILLA